MSVLGKIWKIQNEEREASVLKKLLSNRGLNDETQIERFFHPSEAHDFHDPFLMKDMEKAMARIGTAIEKEERIMIFGDYDVDGITGAAILVRALRTVGAKVSCRLPHRIQDGYGLREKFVREFKKLDVKIIITVDNGISCYDETALAQSLGIDVIISDHHTVPEKIPPAFAILHPKVFGCGYPFIELTGAGVALKIAQALFARHGRGDDALAQERTQHLLDLACMGTIADVGELRGENRYIVKEGLKILEHTRWPGLSRLKEVAGIEGKITTHDIGFLIGPRINAAGRISDPLHALKLLLHDAHEGGALADHLEKLNRERQNMMVELMEIAEGLALPQNNDPVIIVHHPRFHAGVIGLIAARLGERYARPAIAMEQREALLVGSCRSTPDVNIVQALTAVKQHLSHFGGHAAAAGFDILPENLTHFISDIKKHVGAARAADASYQPIITIECELPAAETSFKTVEILKWFEPFGAGNEAPRFLCRNVPVIGVGTVGKEAQHLKITSTMNGMPFECIGFKLGHFADQISKGSVLDIVGELEENVWRGNRKLQIKMLDFRLA